MQKDLHKIYITGDIDDAAFAKFNKSLSRLEHTSKLFQVIKIELISGGGDPYAALAFYDRIRQSKREIHITAYGLVASAAVIILAAGAKRYMAPSSWLMVHEDSMSNDESATVSEIERDAKHFRRLEDQWSALLSSVTPTSIAKWTELHKAETYLTAQECLTLGIIDGIV